MKQSLIAFPGRLFVATDIKVVSTADPQIICSVARSGYAQCTDIRREYADDTIPHAPLAPIQKKTRYRADRQLKYCQPYHTNLLSVLMRFSPIDSLEFQVVLIEF